MIEPVSGDPPFDPAAFLETAAKGRAVSAHRKGVVLFRQGDTADAVFYVKKGKIKVTVVSAHGKEAIVAILGADEFLGEGCLIGQPKRLSTATAMTECVTMRVEKAEIVRVLHDEPAFSQMFVSHILARSARIEEDLVDQLFNSTEKRLARLTTASLGELRQGRAARAHHCEDQSRDAR
jgi:CRP/FNR family transcriptional regulator, cyclic AMP receptor protein